MIIDLYKKFKSSTGVSTDTRKIEKGSIFFALKGDSFNGNDYATKALELGAAFAVIDELTAEDNERFILVDNVLDTLQALARHHRRQFEIPIIAITGTNGKTTTKELISAILSTSYIIHSTQGNFNNHIGVPLTLLSMADNVEVAVIEMGANHKEEIKLLCEIAEPTHGLVTNVGKAHLEGFGSFEGVIKAKGELYDYLSFHNKVAFVNTNEKHLVNMAKDCSRKIEYGKDDVGNKGSEPFLQVEWKEKEILYSAKTNLIGSYNYNNALTAIILGKYFKVSNEKIKTALENYIPKNNRSQLVIKASNKVILDAYNANPTSMAAALGNFNKIPNTQKIVILGDMLELGSESELEHKEIFALAKSFDFDAIITVGSEFGKISKENHFPNVNEMKEKWDWNNYQNRLILIKGSRGIRLEKLME